MLTGDPYAQYKSQSLATLAPGEVLVKLFDECIKQMRLASIGINQRNFAATNDSLTKTQAILTTLASSLDMRYPIAGELKPMYIFLAQQLLKANLKKDSHMIDECISLIKDLREAFSQAEKISRQKHHAVMGGKSAV
ncbi:flagellar export chaperone FliS [Oscillospiraceae bacterium MB08-C2-2]|nr:flagellar export chaperone FliS [Oscillospiraceae bacterium MB08-C2-2]